MSKFNLDDLVRLLRDSAGEDDLVDLDGDIIDVPFDTLGYDSLALFNLIGHVQREYDVRLEDEVVTQAKTPRDMLNLVNEALTAHV